MTEEALCSIEQLLSEQPREQWLPYERLVLAGLYLELNRPEEGLELYKEVGRSPAKWSRQNPTSVSVEDRSEAFEALANYHLRRSEWKEAREYLVGWTPVSWCMNCAVSIGQSRLAQIVLCDLHLRQPEEATRQLLVSVLQNPGAAPEASWLLFCIYDEARQRHDLERIVREGESQHPAGRLVLMGSPTTPRLLLRTTQFDAVEGLIEMLVDPSSSSFGMQDERCQALAFSALSRRGLRAVWETERAIRVVEDPRLLIRALRANRSAAAQRALKRLPPRIKQAYGDLLGQEEAATAYNFKPWPAIAPGTLPRTVHSVQSSRNP
jgi:hypothetical protein